MKRIAVLVSNVGTGSNLQSIIDGIKNHKISAKIIVVITDTMDAQAVVRAQKENLLIALNKKKTDLLPLLKHYDLDYICMAGWKQIIVDEVIDQYSNKIINLHPGIIPDRLNEVFKNPDGSDSLWNRGKLVHASVKEALDKKATYLGASIHFLSHEFDFGKVITRHFEKILPTDNFDSLYKRFRLQENKLYKKALIKLCKE